MRASLARRLSKFGMSSSPKLYLCKGYAHSERMKLEVLPAARLTSKKRLAAFSAFLSVPNSFSSNGVLPTKRESSMPTSLSRYLTSSFCLKSANVLYEQD